MQCKQCGADVPKSKYCKRCGALLQTGSAGGLASLVSGARALMNNGYALASLMVAAMMIGVFVCLAISLFNNSESRTVALATSVSGPLPQPTGTPELTATKMPNSSPAAIRGTATRQATLASRMTLTPTKTLPPPPTSAPTPTLTPAPPTPTPSKLVVDDWEIMVTKVIVTDTVASGEGTEKARGRFAIVFMNLTNKGPAAATFIAWGNTVVRDAAGNNYPEKSIASANAWEQYKLKIPSGISPDTTISTAAVYDISVLSGNYNLIAGPLAKRSSGSILLPIK